VASVTTNPPAWPQKPDRSLSTCTTGWPTGSTPSASPPVPWVLLARQLGSQYGRERDFKAAVVKALRVVELAYLAADVTVTDRGLMLRPSPTPVIRRTVIDV